MATNTGNRETIRQVEISLIRNITEEFVKVFEKYRNIVRNSKNENIRNKFFGILKSQIIESLEGSEKINLIEEIQRGSPSSGYLSESLNNSIYYNPPIYFDNYNNIDVPNENNYHQVDLDQYQFDNGYDHTNGYLMSRGCNKNDPNQSSNESPSLDDEDDGKSETVPEDKVENLNLIISLYDEISNLVENNEDVSEKLTSLKTIHGSEIYQKTIKYIPMDFHNKKQPIIFQLACKMNKYESALDKLKEDDLFKLDQKNVFQTTLLNFLVFHGFSKFYEFLSYLNRRNVQPDICYILLNNDPLLNVVTNGTSSDNKSTKISNEKLLINKGIIYYRDLFQKRIEENPSASKNHDFIDELISNKLLAMVLNESINKSGSYMNDLVNNYPKSESVIRSIFEKDQTLIMESSFFILLARRNIDSFYKILILLVKELKINKTILCQACYRKNEEGQSVVSILEGNNDRNYQRQKQYIFEFIKKYEK